MCLPTHTQQTKTSTVTNYNKHKNTKSRVLTSLADRSLPNCHLQKQQKKGQKADTPVQGVPPATPVSETRSDTRILHQL